MLWHNTRYKKHSLLIARPVGNKKEHAFCKNDNRLEILRFQGGYLYDKGENDEHIYSLRCHNLFTSIF